MSVPMVELPLFPLNSVLFPGGWLPLKIFEPRYLNMVKECARSGTGFGVLRLYPATDNDPAGHARLGTEAIIGDFYNTDDGLLGITAFGRRRFEVLATHTREDGLLVGEVRWLPEEPRRAVPVEFAALSHLLEELIHRAGTDYPVEAEPNEVVSLGYRLTELLPFDPDLRQAILEMEDPRMRLQHLLEILEAEEDE